MKRKPEAIQGPFSFLSPNPTQEKNQRNQHKVGKDSPPGEDDREESARDELEDGGCEEHGKQSSNLSQFGFLILSQSCGMSIFYTMKKFFGTNFE